MASFLEEQFGVASGVTSWDIGRFRLWQSTVPDVILYVPRELVLAKEESGRYHAAVTRNQRWSKGAYEVTGGSATLGVFGDEDAREFESEWTRVVRNSGYKGPPGPKFQPLPVRDLKVTAMLDEAMGAHEVLPASGKDASRTLLFDLSAEAAREWAQAVLARSPVGGSVRLSYSYPQLMPPATATVKVYGPRVYARAATLLAKAGDGTIYGTLDQIRSAWATLVREGAIAITLAGPAPSDSTQTRADLLQRLAEQAREQLFDLLFLGYSPGNADGGSFYALRWRSPADAVAPDLTISVEGWTWLDASLQADIGALLANLDDSYVHDTYTFVSVPVTVVVEPSHAVSNVAMSLGFGNAHAPEAPVFDASGGTRQFLISTERPEQVTFSAHTKISFTPTSWPIVEVSETSALTADGYRAVVRPDAWVRRHMLYMYRRSGNNIVPPAKDSGADYLTVTATYTAPYLAAPIRAASRITPQGPVEFSYPVPPGAQPGRATVSAIGVVGGQLVNAPEMEVNDKDDAVYLLVQDNRVELVADKALIGESDPLAQRLRAAHARPVVVRGIAPAAEDFGELDVYQQVELIPQPTDVSCWAASLAMVVSARDQASTAPETIAAEAGMDVYTGYAWPEIRNAVGAWNLVEEGPRSAMPEEWARLLEHWGPIWVVEVGAPYHAVVLAGVQGDGTPEGTFVTVYNPWPPQVGAVETKSFLEFDQEFGLGAGADAAMVHAVW